jgi:hypothetical protein
MTSRSLLLSSSYFPPIHCMALAAHADRLLIEKEENYIKQSYRNRFHILSANGPLTLSVPVLLGSFHKTPIKDIRIDYSKRWQQIHLGAIISSYRSSPYFEFYFDKIRDVILRRDIFLLDLNMNSLEVAMGISGITVKVEYTNEFLTHDRETNDFRYTISPKKRDEEKKFSFSEYQQVFSDRYNFVPGLSIIDLIFNSGPDTINVLTETILKT